jgi:hypothetical protein
MHPGDGDDIQVIRDELNDLRAELDAERSARGRPWWARAGQPKLGKRLAPMGLIALMLMLPVMVSASHQFSDVPTSHTFHTTISRLYGARLTTGCATGKFCPNANVTRGQMSAFLTRGLGRGAGREFVRHDDNWQSIVDFASVADVVMSPGGTGGGTAHVWVGGTVSIWTSEAGVCPCEVQAYLDADNGGRSELYVGMIGSDMAPADPQKSNSKPYATTAVSLSHLFTVDSGASNQFLLMVKIIPTKAPTWAFAHGFRGTVQAIYLPFGAHGGNAVFPDPPISGGPPDDPRP